LLALVRNDSEGGDDEQVGCSPRHGSEVDVVVGVNRNGVRRWSRIPKLVDPLQNTIDAPLSRSDLKPRQQRIVVEDRPTSTWGDRLASRQRSLVVSSDVR
jgi:hypothetical protein